jgi:flagellar basal-body rod protein FlgB
LVDEVFPALLCVALTVCSFSIVSMVVSGVWTAPRSEVSHSMDSSTVPLFALAERRMAWVDRRQEVLAQNIANANTPGWQPKDLAPFAAQLANAGVAPVQTNPMHLPGKGSAASRARIVAGEHAPDGNAVKVDEQLTKVADTESISGLVSNLYTKYMSLFKTAIGK